MTEEIFNDIFRKDVAYENIKSRKYSEFQPLSKNTFLEKPQGNFLFEKAFPRL